jgi:peptidyl-prolyl cis-trans isomerase SurA
MRAMRWCAIAAAVAIQWDAGAVQAAQTQTQTQTQTSGSSAPVASGNKTVPEEVPRGVELDRVIAMVNGAVILESDVDEERRLMAFQPFRDTRREFSRDQAIERLINRSLILEQARLQPEDEFTDQQVEEQLAMLRKDIPACKAYHCESEAGWKKFVADQGFTKDELIKRWRERMEVLRFIEIRFREGTHISDDEIREYYEKTLLPQYASQKAVAPKLEIISNRIQEILLQQQVSSLLGEWLKSLRAQGTVQTIEQSEATP